MRRREFITLLGGAVVAWPLAAVAQQPERMRRVGVLMAHAESDPEFQAYLAAFREELQKLGWTEGHNIRIDAGWGALEDGELRQRSALELLALQPDLILTQNTPPTASMVQQTRTVPIIFVIVADPSFLSHRLGTDWQVSKRHDWPGTYTHGDKMDQQQIFLPMGALAFLTFLVLIQVPIRRIAAARGGLVKAADFQFGESAAVPGHVSIPNRNYMNLLELPVLFYVGALMYEISSKVDVLA